MINEFLAENTVPNHSSTVSIYDIVGAYRVWLMRRGYKPLRRSEIIEALQEAGYEIGRGHNNVYSVVGISCFPPKYAVEDGKLVLVKHKKLN